MLVGRPLVMVDVPFAVLLHTGYNEPTDLYGFYIGIGDT
ncbi:hypothetical protein URH17368_0710 [Alicyclobacillus hesperidum URH17-3-68]|nr:hypothetical protein URH17368_0710 [Alicyclobacillus hesperidum URH17-3-68]